MQLLLLIYQTTYSPLPLGCLFMSQSGLHCAAAGLHLTSGVLLPSSPRAGRTGWYCFFVLIPVDSALLSLFGGLTFFSTVFSSLTCSVISRVFAQFEQRGEQNPLTNESERGLYFKIIVFLTSCYLPPGGQPVLRASVQYEIL